MQCDLINNETQFQNLSGLRKLISDALINSLICNIKIRMNQEEQSENSTWSKLEVIGRDMNANSEKLENIGVLEFEALLGISSNNFSDELISLIKSHDFRYRLLGSQERESLLVEILELIDSGTLTTSGPQKKEIWEKGWGETLSDFEEAERDIKALVPKFVRKGTVKRLCGKFVMPVDPDFETNFVQVLRAALFQKYFFDVYGIWEFGCGTGHNLLAASQFIPGKRMVGLDWAQASVEIVNRLGETYGLDMSGQRFDMFQPEDSLNLGHRDGVLTIGALEQLGREYGAFLDFLLKKSPQICIHCETMNEIYDRDTVTDYVARLYSKRRNYLDGFLTSLREREKTGALKIIQVQRVFGSQFHEGYSFVVWKPCQ